MKDVIYLYGFAPATAPVPPAALAGIGGGAVELIDADGVRAIVTRLPSSEYGGDIIEGRLDDLAWVGEQGLGHERVVLWFVDQTDVLPARLFSLYADEAALLAALVGRADHLRSELERLAGRREWNLKAAYDSAELGRHGAEVSEELRRMDADIDAAAPGRRYLLERKRADVLKREVGASARRLANDLLDGLRPMAEAVHVLPLPAAGAQEGTVVLAAALLVHRDAEAGLRAEADRRIEALEALGMRVSFSGPWAPYRFLEPVDA
ncbi:MAG TPA: GvpL/GvpF family gas vesicle protein [Longimicrobiales bacterium]|nr:GvpL/GvpF family gas vesicle protein [Longimicrobiales bacterium]